MYLEEMVNETRTPLIGIDYLLEIIETDFMENADITSKKHIYDKILGLIQAGKLLVQNSKEIWEHYNNIVEKIYDHKKF